MEITDGKDIASVSATDDLMIATSANQQIGTGSILSYVNTLQFNLSDKDKTKFFNELEGVLENISEPFNLESNERLIDVLVKYSV